MQKLMKSLIVAFACYEHADYGTKRPIRKTRSSEQTGWGHTFPGASCPFGIVQVSPDTDTIPHNIDGVSISLRV